MKEQICYYCKNCENHGFLCPEYKCKLTGEKVESFDSCSSCDTGEDE